MTTFKIRSFSLFCCMVMLALLIYPSIGHGTDITPPKTCKTYQVPVALAKGQPASYQVTGTLCSQGNPAGKTIQVLVHGFTLTHVYWDLPYQPERYSYVDNITKAGYATFNIDRIGVGKSDQPSAIEVNVNSNAYVLHQIIQKLRSGDISGNSFTKIILVGHSLGTIISLTEASTYGDVDGLIATGFLHTQDVAAGATWVVNTTPAQLDPVFKDENLPIGYMTIGKEARRNLFYQSDNTDPMILDIDNETKGTGTTGEQATFSQSLLPTQSLNIHVPIFLVVGEKDGFFCSTLLSCASSSAILARERLFYSSEGTQLEAYVLQNAGHNINYQKNAQEFFEAARAWTDRYFGQTK